MVSESRGNQKTRVVGYQVEVLLTLVLRPSDEPVPCLDMPGGRSPGRTSQRPALVESDIFEMFAHRLGVVQIMVLFDKAVEHFFTGGFWNLNQ